MQRPKPVEASARTAEPTNAGNRWIDLEGPSNVRCLGGLPTVDGARTRARVVIRSDDPVACTAGDVHRLTTDLGVSLIIDLRSDEERVAGAPCPLGAAGVERLGVPLLDRTAMNIVFQSEEPHIADDEAARWMAGVYLGLAETSGPAFVRILTRLLDNRAAPTLVHCAAGKDRTGVVVALLLALAGVEREAIVADYALTASRMAAVATALEQRSGAPLDAAARPAVLLDAPPLTMRHFLEEFDRRQGDVASWSLRAGATSEQLRSWQDRLVG